MKTLILLLAAAMTAPALGQTSNYNSTTPTPSTSSYGTTATDNVNSSSALDEQGNTGALTDRSSGSSTSWNNDTSTTETTTSSSSHSSRPSSDTSTNLSNSATSDNAVSSPGFSSDRESLSGTSTNTSPATTSPNMAAPATSSATTADTAAATDANTSRAYHEDMGRERKPGGFFVEPAIFGTREDADIKGNLAGTDNTGTSNGFGLDLKLGGHLGEIFFLGADGRYERSRFADTGYGDQDSNVWNWGPVAGLQAPWAGMRVWGTYVVDGNFDPDSGANGADLKFKDPYGWRGGVGFRISNVSLNLEYEDLTYRTTEIQSLGNTAVGTNTGVDFAQRGYAVSLSFPMEL